MFFLIHVATLLWNYSSSVKFSARGVTCRQSAASGECSVTSPITIKWTQIAFCHLLLICRKRWTIQILSLFIVDANIFLSASASYHRGMWEMVKVVLWYIYSCQSVTSWDSDKINSWDVASYHSQYQGAHTPVMQAIQFYLIHPKPIYKLSVSIKVRFTYLQKSCAAVIREQRPTTQVNYSTAVQKKKVMQISLGSFEVLP